MEEPHMAEEQKDEGTQAARTCQTAKELLVEVKAQLSGFEAKKLDQLKTELETFVAAQDALVAEYRTKFPALRKTWCERQLDVERLCAHVKCEFPLTDEKWKNIVKECICKRVWDICCLEKRIVARKKCCGGPRERARDAALEAFNKADAKLKMLKELSKRIEAALAANKGLIDEIDKLAATDRVVSLWVIWKLLPAHKGLTPYDASPESKKVCGEWDPDQVCKEIFDDPCKADDGGCSDGKDLGDCLGKAVYDGPSMIAPDAYRKALDCAWEEYYNAKTKLSEAQAELQREPDDLPSLESRLKSWRETLGEDVKRCLREKQPQDNCGKPADSKKSEA
jgi:hypothetical protein